LLTTSTACRTLTSAQNLALGFPRTEAIALDVSDSPSLDAQISSHNLVISLIPYIYHVNVIRSAISAKVNVVTTSYISPAMRALDNEAKAAGIIVLNEVGLDPGIDHLYAVKTIREVHDKGGKVLLSYSYPSISLTISQIKEFHSYCGGLPAPEYSHNPLRFKFSWSPKGALLSQNHTASFLLHGKHVEIPAKELMKTAKPYEDIDEYDLVAFPNRDSTPFQHFYKIPEAETVVRGSLRYKENPEFVQALKDLGFFREEAQDLLRPGLSWYNILSHLTSSTSLIEIQDKIAGLCRFENKEQEQRVLTGFKELGLFGDDLAPISTTNPTLIDVLSTHLANLLSYKPGERDLVVLQHKFVVEYPDTDQKETITSTLSLQGDPEGSEGGFSAMARTVGVTCGIAAQLVLEGREDAFVRPGVWAPYEKEMAEPIRLALEREGICMVERVVG
jgi:saccharopine dehydrogenase-like NADP-dependent oxidoreductase